MTNAPTATDLQSARLDYCHARYMAELAYQRGEYWLFNRWNSVAVALYRSRVTWTAGR